MHTSAALQTGYDDDPSQRGGKKHVPDEMLSIWGFANDKPMPKNAEMVPGFEERNYVHKKMPWPKSLVSNSDLVSDAASKSQRQRYVRTGQRGLERRMHAPPPLVASVSLWWRVRGSCLVDSVCVCVCVCVNRGLPLSACVCIMGVRLHMHALP